jgi:uncharacterized membrane protein YedE/YeeE
MQIFIAFLSGLIFAAGLVIGGMADPQYVLGFLNIGGLFAPDTMGPWYPRLAFVMLGAVTTMFFVFRCIRKGKPVYHEKYAWPTKTRIDLRLVTGAAIFGIGWGVGGYCPGPALASALAHFPTAGVLVIGMLAGIWVAKRFL